MKVTVVEEKPIPPPPKKFVLELDEDEALILTKIMGVNSFGEFGDNLYNELSPFVNYIYGHSPFIVIDDSHFITRKDLRSIKQLAQYIRDGGK